MKQFFAITGKNQIDVTLNSRYKNCLVSFAYYKGSMKKHLLKNRLFFDSILIDSGAFTFWNQGIDAKEKLDDYMIMLKEDGWKKYIAFDKVFDAEQSKENYKIMLKNDLQPIPCFHINTDIEYLRYYMDTTDHIAIGGMVGAQNIDGNLINIWNEILKRNPNCMVHGLGVSNIDTAMKYPWYSIDSSSWCAITKFARTNIWNEGKRRFITEDTVKEFLPRLGLNIEDGKLSGLTQLLWIIQQEHYNRMIDSINDYQEDKDFNFLTNQQSLFDI